jgi:hypothetical protein
MTRRRGLRRIYRGAAIGCLACAAACASDGVALVTVVRDAPSDDDAAAGTSTGGSESAAPRGAAGRTGQGPGAAQGGGDGGAGAPAAPVAQSDFCAAVYQAYCSGNQGCCPVGDKFASLEACTGALVPGCVATWTGAAYESGLIAYDAIAAGQYVADLAAAAQACEPWTPVDLRDTIFKGTLAVDASCSVGGVDFSFAEACQPELFCSLGQDLDGTCTPRAGPAQHCAGKTIPWPPDRECATDLYCEVGYTGHGSCSQPKPNGAACTAHRHCQSGLCDAAFTCAVATASVYCGG